MEPEEKEFAFRDGTSVQWQESTVTTDILLIYLNGIVEGVNVSIAAIHRMQDMDKEKKNN